MEHPKWVLQSKTIWIGIVGILAAALPLIPAQYATAIVVVQSVMFIGNRIFGGSGTAGAHKPVTLLRSQ